MTHLYLDTNSYLTFYHLTSDDLDELKKISVLIDTTSEITLHLPEQTNDEFSRNRETKIADALKKLREEKLNNLFPQICKGFPEYNTMRDSIKIFEENKSKLIEKLHEEISTHSLEADRIIYELLDKAEFYKSSKKLLKRAKTRFDLGKPPGKNKSYGDALNWETLMQYVPDNEDLYFVSEDKDYYSQIDSHKFNEYLSTEWNKKKKSKIYSFKRISEFFKLKFPDIKLASEYEKEILVKELSGSKTFANTRFVLQKLSKFEDFSDQHLNDIVFACINNLQILWIRNDRDIAQMIESIIQPNQARIDDWLMEEFVEVYEWE